MNFTVIQNIQLSFTKPSFAEPSFAEAIQRVPDVTPRPTLLVTECRLAMERLMGAENNDPWERTSNISGWINDGYRFFFTDEINGATLIVFKKLRNGTYQMKYRRAKPEGSINVGFLSIEDIEGVLDGLGRSGRAFPFQRAYTSGSRVYLRRAYESVPRAELQPNEYYSRTEYKDLGSFPHSEAFVESLTSFLEVALLAAYQNTKTYVPQQELVRGQVVDSVRFTVTGDELMVFYPRRQPELRRATLTIQAARTLLTDCLTSPDKHVTFWANGRPQVLALVNDRYRNRLVHFLTNYLTCVRMTKREGLADTSTIPKDMVVTHG